MPLDFSYNDTNHGSHTVQSHIILCSLKRKVSCIAMRDWQGTNKKDEGCVTVCVHCRAVCVTVKEEGGMKRLKGRASFREGKGTNGDTKQTSSYSIQFSTIYVQVSNQSNIPMFCVKKLISLHTGLHIGQFFLWDPDPIYIQV